jgi:hypothetical protein
VVFLHLRNMLRGLFPIDGVPKRENRRGWCPSECVWINACTVKRIRRFGVEHYKRRLVFSAREAGIF